MENIFFDEPSALLRTIAVGILAYFSLILFLRVSGKRTLSKMNAFDLVVTVSLGSTLATILLNRDVSLAQGAVALALLVFLQFLITWTSVRLRWVRRAVTGEPALLLHDGAFLPVALRRERVTEDEVKAAVRSAGIAALEDVGAVVLETDGSLSVVRGQGAASQSSITGIKSPQEQPSA